MEVSDEGDRLPQAIVRDVGFNPYPAYPLEGLGRPVKYSPESDLRALMLRQLEQIPYVKDLVKRLRRNPYLRRICGYEDEVPTEAHFSQMKRRIREDGFRAIERFLRHEAMRWGATHLQASRNTAIHLIGRGNRPINRPLWQSDGYVSARFKRDRSRPRGAYKDEMD